MCDCYGYHNSKHITTPRRTSGNIKGIELEISDYDCYDSLDYLIDEGILTTPYNESNSNQNIAVEEDGSVYRELVFKACSNRTILDRLKPLEECLHDIDNGHGTSCHIHLNNSFLTDNGIEKIEIAKATEFLYPILYKISGRNMNSLRWCRSFIGFEENDYNLYKRTKDIDDITSNFFDSRYNVVNTDSRNTTELRIFSNYYCFDSKHIKMYLETADFIMKLAKEMKDKSYDEDFEFAFNESKKFFEKRRYKDLFERHNLGVYFASAEEQREFVIKDKFQKLIERIQFFNAFKEREGQSDYEIKLSFLRVIRDFYKNGPNNIVFDIYDVNYDDVFELLKENYESYLRATEE